MPAEVFLAEICLVYMVFLFHSENVMLGFVQNMKIFCSEDLFWLQIVLEKIDSNFVIIPTFTNYI